MDTVKIYCFWGDQCSVCEAVKPKLSRLVSTQFPQVELNFVRVADQPAFAAQYLVLSVPAILIFQGEVEVARFAGVFPFYEVEDSLNRIAEICQ